MTKDPVCCLPGDSVRQAAQIMKEHDIGMVPVMDNQSGKKIAGLVTDRDLVLRVLAERLDPAAALRRVMSTPVITCSPDDGCDRALDLMEKYRIKRLPLVDTYS